MDYIINSSSIILFLDNKPIKFEKSSRQYAQIIEKFDLPENEQEKAIREVIFDSPSSLNKNGFKATDEGVFYKGEKLPEALAAKVLSLSKEGLPLNLFEKFWHNIKENPSCSSVNELYEFLSYKELPITEDGCFLAYKGVDSNFWSISGNKDTNVIKGKVNSSGQIYNAVGERIEVVRRDVDDDRRNHCSHGLHVGSLDYASNFSRGKLVVVKVNPKDVVSVPTDYSCQKCRVSAYEVISEFGAEIKAPAVDENNEPIINADCAARDAFVNRVKNYLNKMIDKGYSEVCVRKIQNSFSPEYPSKNRVLDALEELGYYWHEDDDGLMVVLED